MFCTFEMDGKLMRVRWTKMWWIVNRFKWNSWNNKQKLDQIIQSSTGNDE